MASRLVMMFPFDQTSLFRHLTNCNWLFFFVLLNFEIFSNKDNKKKKGSVLCCSCLCVDLCKQFEVSRNIFDDVVMIRWVRCAHSSEIFKFKSNNILVFNIQPEEEYKAMYSNALFDKMLLCAQVETVIRKKREGKKNWKLNRICIF